MNNRKGELGEVLKENAIYIILLILFFFIMFYFVMDQRDAASRWSDFYSKELAQFVMLGTVGDSYAIDIQQLSSIALKNGVALDSIVVFNTIDHTVCVRASLGRRTCYGYFSDVVVTDVSIELGVPVNVLKFKLAAEEV